MTRGLSPVFSISKTAVFSSDFENAPKSTSLFMAFAVVLIRSRPGDIFPGHLFQIQILDLQVMHRIADHFHLVVPVKQEGLECDVLRKFVQFVQLTVPVDTDRTVKVVAFQDISQFFIIFRLEDEND